MSSKKPPGGNPISRPSSTAGETTQNILPVLTEVVAESGEDRSRLLSIAEVQQLLPQLEAHIETLFTRKLGLHLEQLQRQAIEHAVIELKAELPDLLRDMLNTYLDSR